MLHGRTCPKLRKTRSPLESATPRAYTCWRTDHTEPMTRSGLAWGAVVEPPAIGPLMRIPLIYPDSLRPPTTGSPWALRPAAARSGRSPSPPRLVAGYEHLHHSWRHPRRQQLQHAVQLHWSLWGPGRKQASGPRRTAQSESRLRAPRAISAGRISPCSADYLAPSTDCSHGRPCHIMRRADVSYRKPLGDSW